MRKVQSHMTIILNKQCWKLGTICFYPEEKMGTTAPMTSWQVPCLHGWEWELALLWNILQNFEIATIRRKLLLVLMPTKNKSKSINMVVEMLMLF